MNLPRAAGLGHSLCGAVLGLLFNDEHRGCHPRS